MKTEKEGLCVTEAAAKLGICRTLAYRLVRDGTIPSVRLGRRVLIPVAALEAILSTHNTEEADHAEKQKKG